MGIYHILPPARQHPGTEREREEGEGMAGSTYKSEKLLEGWDEACRRVRIGLERIGHDIRIVGYGSNDEVKMAAAKRKADR